MSDNLLLTVLGAAGVGALIMGMSQNDKKQLKEDFVQYQFQKYATKEVGSGDNKKSVNFAVNPSVQKSVQTIARLNKEGVPQASQVAQLQNQSMNRISHQNASLQRASSPSSEMRENFVSPIQNLGSSAVTRNDYVSYPQFNQTNPLQSPSLNLPAQIRYNPPSLNTMGITNAYQNQPMDYANLVEGYTSVATIEKNPQIMASGFNRNVDQTNPSSFLDALNKGTSSYSLDKNSPIQGSLPLSTMDNGAQGNPANENVLLYDRVMYATGKGGWRIRSNGVSDFIRGDLAVCVDPCQKGWFQSSLQPKDLQTGAINIIAGSGEASSNSDAQKMARLYGNLQASTGSQGQTSSLSTLQKVLLGNSTASGSVNTLQVLLKNYFALN
jgi:hypothetical protein